MRCRLGLQEFTNALIAGELLGRWSPQRAIRPLQWGQCGESRASFRASSRCRGQCITVPSEIRSSTKPPPSWRIIDRFSAASPSGYLNSCCVSGSLSGPAIRLCLLTAVSPNQTGAVMPTLRVLWTDMGRDRYRDRYKPAPKGPVRVPGIRSVSACPTNLSRILT